MLASVTREQFIAAISTDKADKFARTFVAKADMQKLWELAIGYWHEELLLGAIIITVSKRKPICANLQLLHTFAEWRNLGVGRQLCNYALTHAIENNCEYFRVSSEPDAVGFYTKLGIRFWGKQKSGCSLSIFKIAGTNFSDGIYDINDKFIYANLYSGRKGSLWLTTG